MTIMDCKTAGAAAAFGDAAAALIARRLVQRRCAGGPSGRRGQNEQLRGYWAIRALRDRRGLIARHP